MIGREVEFGALDLVVTRARLLALQKIIGEYCPTAKNAIVRDMYERFGFSRLQQDQTRLERWVLDVSFYVPRPTQIHIVEVLHAGS